MMTTMPDIIIRRRSRARVAVVNRDFHVCLSGAGDEPWTGARIWQLVSVQAFLGSTRLIVLPGALLISYPLAAVMAFYRDAAALSDRSLARGYFRPDAVRRMVEDHVSGGRDRSLKLWNLVILELWHREMVDAPRAGVPVRA